MRATGNTSARKDPIQGWIGLEGIQHTLVRYPESSSRDEVTAAIDALGVTFDGGEPSGTIDLRVHRLNTFLLVQLVRSPGTVHWERPTPSSRRRVLFLFVNRGRCEVTVGGRSLDATRGVVIIPAGGDLIDVRLLTECSFVLLSVDDRDLVPYRIGEAPVELLEEHRQVLTISFGLLERLANSPQVESPNGARLVRTTLREIALSLTRVTLPADSRQLPFNERVAEIVERRYEDASFSTKAVALEMGLSGRTLTRRATEAGISVSSVIRARRARHARALLEDARGLRTIVDIARASGFGSVEAMRRSMLAEDASLDEASAR